MSNPDPIFKLRLPAFLREKLEKEAAAGRRTLTAEILSRLEMSFSDASERLNLLEREVFEGDRRNRSLLERIERIESTLPDDIPYDRRRR